MQNKTDQRRENVSLAVAVLAALATMLLVSVALPRLGIAVPASVAWPLLAASGAMLFYLVFTHGWGLTPPKTAGVDASCLRRLRAVDDLESVRWDRLVNVTVATTDQGPFADDFFWLLRESDGSGCAIGSEQAVAVGLLDKLQRLPRFDNQAVIAASGSTSNALFVCWQGSPGEGVVLDA
jgi:hypothetical protein